MSQELRAQSSRLPFLDFTTSSVQVISCLLISNKFEGPKTSSSHSIHCLNKSAQEMVYSLDNHFIIKDTSQETARWNRCTWQGMWQELKHLLCSPIWNFPEPFSFRIFKGSLIMYVSLIRFWYAWE